MTRSSPGVARTVAVLNFFAHHPGQAFTLTDVIRALKISRATCHALLTGLVEAGYLYRTSAKGYVIGPALVALGQIASEHFSPLQAAEPEMRTLADEYDAYCLAAFREKNDVVIRARAAAASHLGWSIPQGQRMPLRAPFGAVYFSWAPLAEAKAWLDQLDPPPRAERRAEMLEVMAFAREYGFVFGVVNARVPPLEEAPERAFSGERIDYPAVLLTEIKTKEKYQLATVIAPVFDARGQVAFVLSLSGYTGTFSGTKVHQIGRKVRDACDRITRFIAGRMPQAGSG